MGIDAYVSPSSVHAIAVIVRNGKSAIVEDAHEPGQAALVRAIGMAIGVSCRYEKHRTTLNERAVLVGKRRADRDLLQAVGEGARFTDVLKLPHSLVIHRIVSHHSSRSSWPPTRWLARVSREVRTPR